LEDLQPNFVEFPGYYVYGYPMWFVSPQPLDGCIDECRNDPYCRYITFRSSDQYCVGGYIEISSVVSNSGVWRATTAFTTYVKTCA
jgi:hypothetical protein